MAERAGSAQARTAGTSLPSRNLIRLRMLCRSLALRQQAPSQKPLGCLQVLRSYNTRHKLEKGTKQERPRRVPVTPLLARILAQWKLSGWERALGRRPKPEDLIIPSRKLTYRSANHMLKK